MVGERSSEMEYLVLFRYSLQYCKTALYQRDRYFKNVRMVKYMYVKLLTCIVVTVYYACTINIFAFTSCKLRCTAQQKFFDDATASDETA
jgi:hypothetical protein